MNWYRKSLTFFMGLGAIVLLAGCSATKVVISKRNLDVQTKMSDTIFLDPAEEDQMNICIQVKNTSDRQLEITDQITSIIESKGYKVVKSVNNAHYLLQVNILFVDKIDPTAAEKAFNGGFGSELSSIGTGVATAALVGRGNKTMVAGGLIGGVLGTIADSVVKDVTYIVIADLQVSHRPLNGEIVRQKDHTHLKQGKNSVQTQKSFGQADWKRYQTRVVSKANKVNLKFETAKPILEKGIIKTITGIF